MSHLQQALENLLFNARDATFEMRNHLREQARLGADGAGHLPPERRHALIAAAGWKGEVVLRTRKEGNEAILEVQDNGVGMSDDVRRRCIETHFSTKRDNALFAGMSAGMGLGLSFVQIIMEHHAAKMEIESTPMQGALFRLRFPSAERS
jgi:signal transduction histidine kinase